MAYEFNGTNQYLNTASTPVTGTPLTLACWFNSDSATALQFLLSIDAGGANYYAIAAAGNSAGDPVSIFYRGPGIGNRVVSTSTGYSVGTWHHACGVFSNTTDRTVYIDAGSSTSESFTQNINNATGIKIGTLAGGSQFPDGRIAEVGIWNAALTAAEIASLAKGMTCDKVRPQSLVFYAPLIRNLQDVRGGLTITNNNTATVANHPRVYA
jgi:hypothetical protein